MTQYTIEQLLKSKSTKKPLVAKQKAQDIMHKILVQKWIKLKSSNKNVLGVLITMKIV